MKITSKMLGAVVAFLSGAIEVLRVLEAYKASKEAEGKSNGSNLSK